MLSLTHALRRNGLLYSLLLRYTVTHALHLFLFFHSAFAIQMLSLTAISLSQRATLFVFLCFAALLFLDFQIPLDGPPVYFFRVFWSYFFSLAIWLRTYGVLLRICTIALWAGNLSVQ